MRSTLQYLVMALCLACLLGQACPLNVNVGSIDASGSNGGSSSQDSASAPNSGGGAGGSGSGSAGAPSSGGAVTLLSERAACTFETDSWCRLRLTFSPTQVGRSIRVEVTGDLTNSRPVFGVDDSAGSTVADTGLNPTSNVAVETFTATNTGPHHLTVREFAHFSDRATVFSVSVIQD